MRASHLFVSRGPKLELLQRILREGRGDRDPVWLPASRMRL